MAGFMVDWLTENWWIVTLALLALGAFIAIHSTPSSLTRAKKFARDVRRVGQVNRYGIRARLTGRAYVVLTTGKRREHVALDLLVPFIRAHLDARDWGVDNVG